jgi:predicted peptidase
MGALIGIAVMTGVLAIGKASAQVGDFLARSYKGKDGMTIPYRLFIPKNYDAQKSYPLVVAMHGAGERGTDNMLQLTTHKLATVWAVDSNQAKHPSFIFAPQCPPYPEVWVNTPFGAGTYNVDKVAMTVPMKTVLEILDSLIVQYRIDTSRIYLAGLSMGGYATWYMLMKYPQRFAAAIPICGAGDTAKAPLLNRMPIWAFHGDSDKTVPVAGTRQMIAAIRKAGGSPLYTEYPGVDHGSWGPALQEPKLVDWAFAQKKNAATSLVRTWASHDGKSAHRSNPESDPESARPDMRSFPTPGFMGPNAESGVDGLGRAEKLQPNLGMAKNRKEN